MSFRGVQIPRALVALCGLLLTSAACSRDPAARTRQYLANGDGFAKAGKYREASIEYRNALKVTPGSVEAEEKLAAAATGASDQKTAVAAMLRVAELKPDDPAAQIRAAALYLLAGQYAEARDRAADAVRLAPDAPEPHLSLGSADWSVGRTGEAEAELRKSVELDPRSAEANRALALLLMATGRAAQAEPLWQVVATSPRGRPFALVDYLVAVGRLTEAGTALTELVSRAATRDGARVRLAAVQFALKQRAAAHATLQALLLGLAAERAGAPPAGALLSGRTTTGRGSARRPVRCGGGSEGR